MTTLKILFWICIFLVVYTYVGYGVLLWLLVKLKRLFKGKPAPLTLPKDEDLPHVTFLICAYNEQDVVDMKMENTLQLDYPKNKLHIMWVTDGSTDETNERLKRYPEVEIVYSPERRGKTAALNHGIEQISSEITVMTDANTLVNREALRNIVVHFQDPDVGCVAGEKRVMARTDGETAAQGEGLYWRYESTLKRLDSELYSAMGAAGELNAIRTTLYEPMPENALLDDFVMSMRIVDRGYRIAYAPDAYAMEYGSANLHEESKRKRRIAAGGLQSTWWLRSMMNPFRHFTVAFQFVSVPSRITLDHHPLCPPGTHTPQRTLGVHECRPHLRPHLGVASAVLLGCFTRLLLRATWQKEQIAVRALLFPLHEPERILRNTLSEKPSARRNMGEGKTRLIFLASSNAPF